jgi:hypothetical protein
MGQMELVDGHPTETEPFTPTMSTHGYPQTPDSTFGSGQAGSSSLSRVAGHEHHHTSRASSADDGQGDASPEEDADADAEDREDALEYADEQTSGIMRRLHQQVGNRIASQLSPKKKARITLARGAACVACRWVTSPFL